MPRSPEQNEILRRLRSAARKIRAGDEARRDRDALYVEARDAGLSLAEIASAASMKENAVKMQLRAVRLREGV